MSDHTVPPDETSERVRDAKEHVRSARHSLRMSWEDLMPRGFIDHQRAARREMLLAMRSLIDAAIDRTVDRTERHA